jgi:hypothetical protein
MKFWLGPMLPESRGRRIVAVTVCLALYAPLIGAGSLLLAGPRLTKPELSSLSALIQIPSGKEVVAPSVYVSRDPAGRGTKAEIAVVMKIKSGFHVNAREKSADYLIATDLKGQPPAGVTLGEVAYPKGQLEKFTFSKTPLNVYQGNVTLRVPLTIASDAPTGEQHVPLKLRYQACSSEVCLPPVTLPLDAALNIARDASNSKPAHQDIFSAPN